ncbi:MAG: YdgA family protein [Candidatus Competibacteraceae bacterium]|nr:YdgA family protein [Candidatus Competibacteraceae bacterium]
MKKLIGVIAVALVLAAGFTGAAYWSGQKAERWYKETVVEASKHPNLKITTTRYERGVFSSKASTRYQLVLEKEAPEIPELSFSTREEIYHGPLPLAGWGVAGVPMAVTGAVVRQTLEPESSAWTRELAKLYGGQEPVVAVAQVGFDGASNTRITMPPLAAANIGELQNFDFAGLQGQFQVAPHGAAIRGNMTVASLEAVGKAPVASEGPPAAVGPRMALRDLLVTVDQRKGEFELMFGNSNFKIGELRVQDPSTGNPVVFSNLAMDATAALNAQNPQQVNVDVLFKTDRFVVEPWSGNGNMRLAFHNLDGVTLGKLEQWQQKAATNPDDPQVLNELLRLVKALLRGKPEFALDTQAKLTQGDWQSKLVLNFQDFGDIDPLQNPGALIGALEKGVAEVTVAKSLAEAVLTSTAKEQLRTQAGGPGGLTGEQAIQNAAAQQVAAQLKDMVATGFIQLEGDRYRSTARFENGKLLVNDKEIPLGLGSGGGDGLPLESDDGAEIEIPPEPDVMPPEGEPRT